MAIKLITGLQNPGPAYENTRHNAGSWLVQALVSARNAAFSNEKKMHGLLASFNLSERPVKALLPVTFMNLSGLAVKECSQFYRILPEEILVVHDELDLPPGRIKLKTGGGHGGHNGLRDIITQLGTAEFHRLRIGIGHPGHRDLVHNYVLGKPSPDDKTAIQSAIKHALEILPDALTDTIEKAMNLINS